MYKFLMVSCLSLMMPCITVADEAVETCANGSGIVITGAIRGHKYCKSNNTMNWWNAYAWCDAQGRLLFDLDDCGCDGTRNCQSQYWGLCPELAVKYGTSYAPYAWSSVASSKEAVYYVSLQNGWLLNGYSSYNDHASYRDSTHRHWALCK